MKKMPKNVQRAYAVASYIGASLKAYEFEDPELFQLHLQVKRAMQSYLRQADIEQSNKLINDLGDLWQELGDKHSATIDEDSVPALIEAFCMVIHPKDFKDFLGVNPYYKEHHQFTQHYSAIMKSVNALNDGLNNLLGTKSVVLQKPKAAVPKIKKQKEKSKAQKEHEKEVKLIAEQKARKKQSLKEMIAKAKEKVK